MRAKLGKTDEVVESYEKVVSLDDGNVEAWTALARLYFEAERWADAEKASIAVLRAEEENAEMLVIRGTSLNRQERSDEAVPILQKAVKVAPEDAIASLQLAIAYNAVERWQQAQQSAEKAIRVWDEGGAKPEPLVRARAYKELAKGCQALEDDREAIGAFLKAAEHDPEFILGFLEAGRLSEKLEKWEDAARAYGRAAERKPDDVEVHRTHGALLERLGKHAEAVEAWQRAVKLDEEEPKSLTRLGFNLSQVARWDDARKTLSRAVKIRPDIGEAFKWLGKACLELDDLDAAKDHLTSAPEIDSKWDL